MYLHIFYAINASHVYNLRSLFFFHRHNHQRHYDDDNDSTIYLNYAKELVFFVNQDFLLYI